MKPKFLCMEHIEKVTIVPKKAGFKDRVFVWCHEDIFDHVQESITSWFQYRDPKKQLLYDLEFEMSDKKCPHCKGKIVV